MEKKKLKKRHKTKANVKDAKGPQNKCRPNDSRRFLTWFQNTSKPVQTFNIKS